MEFQEVLARRRMVRNYTDQLVDTEQIERIVAAGRGAPSAGFTQGQSFVVVTDAETRSAIADLANEPGYVAAGFDPWVSRAPVHIVVCVSEEAYHKRYQEADKTTSDGTEIDWPVPFWWVDAGASMMAVLLAAVDEGLSAGFLGTHAIDGLKHLLNVPDNVSPIGIVTVGHAADDQRSTSLKRGWKSDGDVIHWQAWGD